MARVGLVRVSTQKQEAQGQHEALDLICVRVFEEKVSRNLKIEDRPGAARTPRTTCARATGSPCTRPIGWAAACSMTTSAL